MRVNISPDALVLEAADALDEDAFVPCIAHFLSRGLPDEAIRRDDNRVIVRCNGAAEWAALASVLESGVVVAPVRSVVYAEDLANLPRLCRRDTPF